ncbi:iron complex outermembrane receptor protein [Sinobacterium caligoides]|uniref:Iron complex outermembrane receptor protein n=1 Tax=Sinobacterium caligoides TaxID=933926 RepID=A0A3N2DYL3_9GAMM|nr:TonB-dependent receptor [Sinobacterium caligoides]ROS04609.1 iron complex outermembrane receptor protein [Sinobacterium caligoides]
MQSNTFPRRSLLTSAIKLVIAASLANSTSAYAEPLALEEVVVTAQKRAESLHDTPISISAFTESDLENYDIKEVQDISNTTPNVRFSKSGGGSGGNVLLNIRGIAETDPAITRDLTVGMYLDGVFIGRSAGAAFDIVDLERVEVLRGPQGTLYGKNTIGGAVNFITAKPTGELGLKQTFSAGNYGLLGSRTSINLPALGETGEGLGKLSAKLAYNYTQRDGYYDALLGSSVDEFDNLDSQGGRIALLWELTDDTRVNWSSDYTDKKNIGQPLVFDTDRDGDVKRPDEVMGFYTDESSLKSQGHALEISSDYADLGFLGDVTFKSISAYRKQAQKEAGDYSPNGIFYSNSTTDVKQLSQELQAVGTTLDDRLDYAIGLYYFSEQGDVWNPQTILNPGKNPPATMGWVSTIGRYGMDNTSYAAYGQATYTPEFLEERMSFTLGLRYTRDEKDQYLGYDRTFNDFPLPSPMPRAEAEDTFTKTTPTITVDFAWTDSLSTYAKIATGFRSGGFNTRTATAEEFQTAFKPEDMTSYELGMKSEWFENRMRLNAAVFYNDYTDMQVVDSEFNPGLGIMGGIITNAGKASVYGGEIELTALISEDLTVNANYGYTDIDYKEYVKGGVDIANNADMSSTPNNTFSLSADYFIADIGIGQLRAFADYSWQSDSDFNTDVFDPSVVNPTGGMKQSSYSIVNGRIVLSEIIGISQGDLQIAAWGKNLTDEEYYVHGIDFGQQLGRSVTFGDPRSYGVDITYRY